ncbi:MAG: NAD(P)-dependent oxidoreductase [Myxococcota bacterium]
MTRVLLTGAGGKVGPYAVQALIERGFEVVATDLSVDGIPGGVRFQRCDLTDAAAVDHMMSLVRPDVVVHCAAVVAPVAYAEPALAERVNLGGTKHLIDATSKHSPDAFVVFISSYAAFGPVCPTDPIRGPDDPCTPCDNYGSQKLVAEGWLRESGLRQCSLRLGGVLSPLDLMPGHPSYRPFLFMVSLDQTEHGVDVRDVAHAVASAVAHQPDGKVLLIGGDDSWKATARVLRQEVFGAIGLPTPSERAFRTVADPSVPDGWFYESWMDTRESQELLQFQRTTREDMMREIRENHRRQSTVLRPLRPLIAGGFRFASPYLGFRALVPGPTIWDDICRVYDVPRDVANAPTSSLRHGAAPVPAS